MTRRKGDAVGGDHAITGTLPTLADVIAFKDGSAQFDHGYYRFVSHPRLRRLEDELNGRFACRHCKLTESPQVALLELILCLRKPGIPCRIIVCTADAAPLLDPGFLPACEREGVSVIAAVGGAAVPADLGPADILLISPGDTGGSSLAAAASAAAPGAQVIAVMKSDGTAFPVLPRDLPGAKFFVLGLGARSGAHAGAVLGNVDRVMDRLSLQLKRRGPSLSSRVADCLLEASAAAAAPLTRGEDPDACRRVKEALCQLEGGTHAFLYCSGMSAITRVLDLLRTPERPQVLAVGHLYNDTFQTLRLGPAVFVGVDELDALEGMVGNRTSAILTETITNPLSDVPDLAVLSRIAHEHGLPLVVDNTIATPYNCRPFEFGADFVIHSTTKFLNGRNDHAGGAVIVRQESFAGSLAACQALLDDQMSPQEAAVLQGNMGSLQERIQRFNANAVAVASFLAAHPGASRVFYNGNPDHRSYAIARRILRGPGSVISFVLSRDTREGLRAFYDSPLSGISKAPSLGSDATLLCPYTLLTHFDDTDEELAAIGLPRFLLRIAVGCERTIAPVLDSLEQALQASLAQG
jgi:cystathionine beta-lyase/cystathionine gamma-synthase